MSLELITSFRSNFTEDKLSMTDSMTDSMTKSETAEVVSTETAQAVVSKTSNTGFTFKSKIGSWADYTDSEDDDDEPVAPVPAVRRPVQPGAPVAPVQPVQPKTWGKLPVKLPVKVPVKVPVIEPEPEPEQKPNSIRTLMVKNLPRDTTPEKLTSELRFIFKAFGSIKDVYIPINRDGTYAGTIKGFAKVQFHNADHSAKAVSQSITIRKNKLVIEYAKEDR